MLKVLIIEDEAKAARALSQLLLQLDDTIEVMAILDSVETAVPWFASHQQPDLIFSDIQLADGVCFDLYRQVTITSPIVFCTAFDEYLMKAFDMNAVSYLLKPITIEKLEKALDKYHTMRTAFQPEQHMQQLTGLMQQLQVQYKTALLVYQKEKIIPVQVKDIAFFYLDNTLIHIVTLTHQKYFLTATMDELEQWLDPAQFYRANRQFIINRQSVASAERFFARKLVAKLLVDTPETIVVSKAKASAFLQWLQGF